MSDSIKFVCAVCGKQIKAPANRAGTAAKCPQCGEPLRVPALSPPEPPPLTSSTAASAAQKSESEPSKTPHSKRGTTAILVIGAVVLSAGFFWLGRVTAPAPTSAPLAAAVPAPVPAAASRPEPNLSTSAPAAVNESKPMPATLPDSSVQEASIVTTNSAPEKLPQKQVSAEVQEFRKHLKVFLREARAGAKLLTLVPSVSEATKKSDEITEMYTHLPDVPEEIEDREEVAKKIKEINGTFSVGEYYSKMNVRAMSLNSVELMEGIHDDCVKLAENINQRADEIEKMVNAE